MIQLERPAYAGRSALRPQAWGAAANGQRGKCVQHAAPGRSSSAHRRPDGLGVPGPSRGPSGDRAPARTDRGTSSEVESDPWPGGETPPPRYRRPGQGGKESQTVAFSHALQGACAATGNGFPPLPRPRRGQGGRGIQPWRAPRHAANGGSSRAGKVAIGVTIRSRT